MGTKKMGILAVVFLAMPGTAFAHEQAPAQQSMPKSIKLYALPNRDNSELSIGLCCRF